LDAAATTTEGNSMTQKDTIDIVAEATDLRRKLEEARIIAGYYRGRMEDAEVRMASMELNEKLNILDSLKTPKHGWIKTADRKPETGHAVLAAQYTEAGERLGDCKDTFVSIMRYAGYTAIGCCWTNRDGMTARPPKYWMPLPPLPEEGK
jgi:hypothetical protein